METTSLVLHDVDADDLPRRARVGVVSAATWDWVTTAVETGAADVGVEDGWTPAFPSGEGAPTVTPDPAPDDGRAPRVDFAVAAADVLVVDGQPYSVRTVYSGESSYALDGVSVDSIPAPDDRRSPEAVRVATVSDLPEDQRRIALAAIASEYRVGFHERRSEAFDALWEYDYLRHDGETYRVYVAQGDNFSVHTTLWAEPVETADEDAVVFEVEPVALSERGHEVVTTAIESPTANVETVPETLAGAVERFDALATTTALYRARLR